MSVRLHLACDGCEATAEGDRIQQRFISVFGRDYGLGSPVFVKPVEESVPEGWVAWDPYTYACYCPKCWASILTPEEHSEWDAGGVATTRGGPPPGSPPPSVLTLKTNSPRRSS